MVKDYNVDSSLLKLAFCPMTFSSIRCLERDYRRSDYVRACTSSEPKMVFQKVRAKKNVTLNELAHRQFLVQ